MTRELSLQTTKLLSRLLPPIEIDKIGRAHV